MDNFSMMQQDGGMSDLFGILDLLRQLYALRGQQQGGGQSQGSGMSAGPYSTAGASSGPSGGGARQLPTQPVGGGMPTYGLPPGWTQDQGPPAGWPILPGGVMRDPNSGDTYDAAGNLLTIGQGVSSPQMTQPTDRIGWLRALHQSMQPDRYGNTPWTGGGPGSATAAHIPNFGAPALAGNMIDPRNWDPTMWVNHPEWHNPQVDRAQRIYEIGQGQGNLGRPYSANTLRQAANDWRAFGYGNKQDWKAAGRPTTPLGS